MAALEGQTGSSGGRDGRPESALELYWLPLGAGGHSVKWNGRAYEWIVSRRQRRPRLDLYHAALLIELPEARYVIEQAPVRDMSGADRGVVSEGPVGARWAGRFRLFRYELRVWPGGSIPDVAEAVESPVRLSVDEAVARRTLEIAPAVPTLVWGRDELGAGEMWNSNSVIAWILTRSGVDCEQIRPPSGGRAPGWNAGLLAAGAQAVPRARS